MAAERNCYKCGKLFISLTAKPPGTGTGSVQKQQCYDCRRLRDRIYCKVVGRSNTARTKQWRIDNPERSRLHRETYNKKPETKEVRKRSRLKLIAKASDAYITQRIRSEYGIDVTIPPEYLEFRKQLLLLKRAIGPQGAISAAYTISPKPETLIKKCPVCKELRLLKDITRYAGIERPECKYCKATRLKLKSEGKKLNEARRKSNSTTA